ncbi:MAG: cation-translocating P-type ATPase [Campylobacter sp.]|nr:cation-translocating P-type ATPase [Campylobacter sp.]
MEKLKLNIAGMTCVNCSNAIERVTSKIDGVSGAKVNFANGVGEFMLKDISLKDSVIDKIKKLGYEVAFDVEEFEKKREKHIKFLLQRCVVAGVLSIIIMSLEMFVTPNFAINLLMLVLGLFVLIYSGRSFFTHAYGALRNKSFDMNVLVSLGTGSAFLYSFFVFVLGDAFPSELKHMYFSGPGMIITFVLFGKFLEERSKAKASDYLKTLMDLMPKNALLVTSDAEAKEIPASELKVGDVVMLKSGFNIACDGVIVQGGAEIDTSTLTGESLPVYKQSGDLIYAGGVVTSGYINVRVNKPVSQSLIAQILMLLSDASTKKMPISRLADKISNIFVPSVIAIACLTFVVWMIFTQNLTHALLSAVCVLIISCPCALGLATPIGIISALARGAKSGILIKNPEVIEIIKDVKFAVFDKTGTLSKGQIEVLSSTLNDDELALLASVERLSEHPISKAIVRYVKNRGIKFVPNKFEFKNLVGLGISAKDENNALFIGNEKLMSEQNIVIDEFAKQKISEANSRGEGVVLFANNGEFLGFVSLSDELRDESPKVISDLKNLGIKTIMLSGDNENVVKTIAKSLQVDEYYANALPSDKFDKISELCKLGKVLFVGDGVNDSPSLKQADVGMAMNSGTDIAKAAGDIVLVRNDLNKVLDALKLGKSAMTIIKENLFWAFIYNLICIPIAAGVLYPFFGILLSPVYGALAMCFSSITVVLNSLRLRYKEII